MPKGLVVPDDPSPSDWQIVPLRIPNDAQWSGIVRGLLLEACFGYWWKKSTGDWEAARDTACEIAAGFEMTTFCEEVTKCLLTDGGTRDAVDEIVDEKIKAQPDLILGQGVDGIETCNKDKIFGAATQLVDSINTFIVDAFEIIEASTNIIETVSRYTGAFPIFGQVLQFVIDSIDAILTENIPENYNAAFTASLRDTYRCDIFCIFVDNDCTVTPRDLLAYFADRVGAITFDTVLDVLEFFVTGTWSGTQLADAMYFLAIGMIAVSDGIGFFDLSATYTLDTMIALGARNPSSDWDLLCDPCVSEACVLPLAITFTQEGCYRLDSEYSTASVTDDNGNFYATAAGAFVSNRTQIIFYAFGDIDTPATVENASFDFWFKFGSEANPLARVQIWLLDDQGTELYEVLDETANYPAQQWITKSESFTPVANVATVRVSIGRIGALGANVASGTEARIDNVAMS